MCWTENVLAEIQKVINEKRWSFETFLLFYFTFTPVKLHKIMNKKLIYTMIFKKSLTVWLPTRLMTSGFWTMVPLRPPHILICCPSDQNNQPLFCGRAALWQILKSVNCIFFSVWKSRTEGLLEIIVVQVLLLFCIRVWTLTKMTFASFVCEKFNLNFVGQ